MEQQDNQAEKEDSSDHNKFLRGLDIEQLRSILASQLRD
jgi:hypothetical protein